MRTRPTIRAGAAGLLVALLAAVLPIGATAASASDGPRLGGVMWSETKGNELSLLSIVSEGGCPESAKYVSATLEGEGMPRGGQIIVAPNQVSFSSDSPMLLPVSNAFVVYAEDNATALVGKYTVTIRCTDRFGVTSKGDYVTSMTWKTPGEKLANIDEATFVAKNTAEVDLATVKAPDELQVPMPSPAPEAAAPNAGPAPESPAPAATPVPEAAAPAPSASPAPEPAVSDSATPVAADTSGDGGGLSTPLLIGLGAVVLAALAAAAWWLPTRKRSTP